MNTNIIDDITLFLPKYPNINNEDIDFLNPYTEDFYTSIFKKKEFYDERLEESEEVPEQGTLLKHQKIISRFLSSYTLYDQILLMHQMGTGKTQAAIGVIELILKNENSTFTGAIICVKGKGLFYNFEKELKKATKGDYVPANLEYLTAGEKVARTNKLIRQYYDLCTFYEVAKRIKNLNDEAIVDMYSNKIIVLDEVHNIRLKEKGEEDVDIYKEFFRFFHLVKNCKIILLSGTPIKDKIVEFADIMNLILPLNNQFETNKTFLKEYFNENDGLYKIKPNMITKFKQKIKGRVSYLKTATSQVNKEFMGEKIGTLKFFKVYLNGMSKFQSEIYLSKYNKFKEDQKEKKDKKAGAFYLDCRQASLFVFPDGSVGSKAFPDPKNTKEKAEEKYIKLQKKSLINKKNTKNNYVLTAEFKKILGDGNSEDEILENVKKYSITFYSCIKNILKCVTEGKSSFIYCEYVFGSGGILFSLILELFGFKRATGSEQTKGRRYAIINNETVNKTEQKDLMKRFNEPDNLHGEYINVIIGSKVVVEGFSFLNIQAEYIFTPHWNYSETDQAIARGYRYGGHKDLIESGIIPKVEVYQYACIPENNKGKLLYNSSIDLQMYETSETKDINIKQIERLIKEASVDCALTYRRNYTPGFDYKRECDYMKCEYSCDGIPAKLYKTDKNNFENKTIEQIIIEVLRNMGKYSEIIKKYETYVNIRKALKEILIKNNLVPEDFKIKNYKDLISTELDEMYDEEEETDYESVQSEGEEEPKEEDQEEPKNEDQEEPKDEDQEEPKEEEKKDDDEEPNYSRTEQQNTPPVSPTYTRPPESPRKPNVFKNDTIVFIDELISKKTSNNYKNFYAKILNRIDNVYKIGVLSYTEKDEIIEKLNIDEDKLRIPAKGYDIIKHLFIIPYRSKDTYYAVIGGIRKNKNNEIFLDLYPYGVTNKKIYDSVIENIPISEVDYSRRYFKLPNEPEIPVFLNGKSKSKLFGGNIDKDIKSRNSNKEEDPKALKKGEYVKLISGPTFEHYGEVQYGKIIEKNISNRYITRLLDGQLFAFHSNDIVQISEEDYEFQSLQHERKIQKEIQEKEIQLKMEEDERIREEERNKINELHKNRIDEEREQARIERMNAIKAKLEEEDARRKMEEAERQRQEEQRQRQEEAERQRQEAERQRQEEAERQRQEAERQRKEEEERQRQKDAERKRQKNKKPCKEDEIRNPETDRCVKKDGSIGKRILREQKEREEGTFDEDDERIRKERREDRKKDKARIAEERRKREEEAKKFREHEERKRRKEEERKRNNSENLPYHDRCVRILKRENINNRRDYLRWSLRNHPDKFAGESTSVVQKAEEKFKLISPCVQEVFGDGGDGDDGGDDDEMDLDLSTYELYYNKDVINKLSNEIINLYKVYFKLDLNVIMNRFSKDYTSFEVITALRDIINKNKVIYNKYGFPSYLKENNNIYFLVDDLTVESNYYSEYYTQNPIVEVKIPFTKIIDFNFIKEIPNIVKKLFKLTDIEKMKSIINKQLPLDIQEMILENSIIANIKDLKVNKLQRKLILEIFKDYYKELNLDDGKVYITTLLNQTKKIYKCLEVKEVIDESGVKHEIDKDGWKLCKEKFISEYIKTTKAVKKDIEEMFGGYYGLYNAENFCIKIPENEKEDARKLRIGRKCNTLDKKKLLDIIVNIFKVPLPDKNESVFTEPKKNINLHKEIESNSVDSLTEKIILINEKDALKKIEKDADNAADYNSKERKFIKKKKKDYADLSDDDIKRIYYWTKQQTKPRCEFLQKWLKSQGAAIIDPNCGIQRGKVRKEETDKDKETKTKKTKSKKKMKSDVDEE